MFNNGLPFLGSEAVAAGVLKKHELRSRYRLVFPNVYVAAEQGALTLGQRARAAWLWSHRQGVIAGLTASALHGAKWVDDDLPIELICQNTRPPQGLRTYDFMAGLDDDERGVRVGLPTTTPERTAFDIGRLRNTPGDAVSRLDALGNATGLKVEDVLRVAQRHRGARGLRRLEVALDLYDPGAQSLKETQLRLLVIRAGYPRPRTQIPVRSVDGRRRYYLDMGWEELMLAIEYDGDQHRLDPMQFAHDIGRSEDLDELGWIRVRVVKRHSAAEVLRRLSRAWTAASLRTDREIA